MFKIIEFEDRNWRIGKFSAQVGSYIAYSLMGEILPMGITIDGIPKAPAGSKIMSKSDFIDLQNDCLKICSEMLPAGPATVLNENGSWGVEDIENNPKLALVLMIQALMWNITDFFDENLLLSLATGLSGILPSTART